MIWHSESLDNILRELDVSRSAGLTHAQADARSERFGDNVPPVQETHTFKDCLKAAFHNPGVPILLISAVIIIAFSIYRSNKGYPTDWSPVLWLSIGAIALAIVTAISRYSAEARLTAVCKHAETNARVMREGTWFSTPSDRLVPGDIIRLQQGDLIPADCRILESFSLLCDESILTGETAMVSKNAFDQLENITPQKKRTNMLYSGCMVSLGSAQAVVVETGANTEIHRQQILQLDDRRFLPHQQTLSKNGQTATALATVGGLIVLVAAIVCQNYFPELLWSDMLMAVAAVILASAALTLGIPALIALTEAVRRAGRHGILVQHLNALEKAGHATALILDRFSLLTENRFTVKELYTGGEVTSAPVTNPDHATTAVFQLAVLCTRDPAENDSMDLGVARYAEKIGMNREKLHRDFPRVGVIPSFGSRHRMTAIHLISGKNVAILKGDPLEVLPCCAEVDEEAIQSVSLEMEKRGERVLAVAYRYLDEIPTNPTAEEIETSMIFVGLIGMADKPRGKAEQALFTCREAGIRTVVVTGDSLAMATATAKSMHLIEQDDEVLDGRLLSESSDQELLELLPRISVVSRATADGRTRLIQLLQKQGNTVIMTGDDARDAAAMKAADVSVAIGDCSDIARISADITIPNGRLETLVYAIRTGRGVKTSIRKAASFRLAATFGMILTEFLGLLFGGCLILTPTMLFTAMLLTELCWVPALASERAEHREMKRPPRPAHTPVFSASWILRGIGQGAIIGGAVGTVFAIVGVTGGNWTEQAVSQAALAFLLMLATQAFTFRFSLPSLLGSFNWKMIFAVIATAVLTALAVLIPPIAAVFGLAALPYGFMTAVTVTAVSLILTEIAKTAISLLTKRSNQ